jgi:molecular chaperone DnaJ
MKRFFRTTIACAKNFYQELGVKPTDAEADIKKAYFALAKKYHPDLNPDPSAKL